MPYQDLLKQRKGDFDAALGWVKNEIASIRTGRANASLVEDVQVEYLGSKLKIKELATITTPEPRTLFIQPWDKQAIPMIEKAIRDNLSGLNPSSDSNGVRVTLPSLTEERRKELTRLLHQKIEEARVKTRHIREDIIKRVNQEVKDKLAREGDLHKAKEAVQKVIDDINNKFDELTKRKEDELKS